MARLHISKTQLAKDFPAPASPARSAYDAFPNSPHSKSPSKRTARPILYGVNSSILSQRKLPTPVGQFGFLERPHLSLDSAASMSIEPNISLDSAAAMSIEPNSPTNFSATPTAHQRKRLAQTLRWQNQILPLLVAPYMKYVQESANLSLQLELEESSCSCMGSGKRTLDVVIVRFNSEFLSDAFIHI